MNPRRPTLREIRAELGDARPAKRFGQHFLHERAALDAIVAAADLAPGDAVLEVGPGPGVLTAALLQRGARVFAVDVDPRMLEVLQRLVGPAPGLVTLNADVLDGRGALAADVFARLRAQLDAWGCARYALVANLPYNVASPLLVETFFQSGAAVPRRAVVTIQREVAERMAAAPGSAAYGALSVLLQVRARITPVMRLAPGAFWPPPRVDSTVVRIDPAPLPAAAALDPALLREVIDAVFTARRKSLRNSLAQGLRGRIEPDDLDRVLADQEFVKEGGRGEQLAPIEIVELARALAPRLGSGPRL